MSRESFLPLIVHTLSDNCLIISLSVRIIRNFVKLLCAIVLMSTADQLETCFLDEDCWYIRLRYLCEDDIQVTQQLTKHNNTVCLCRANQITCEALTQFYSPTLIEYAFVQQPDCFLTFYLTRSIAAFFCLFYKYWNARVYSEQHPGALSCIQMELKSK